MDPFTIAAIPRILSMIPSLLSLLGGEKAENNAKIAQVVVDTFTAAVPGAVNAQDAVEKAEASPSVKAVAVATVEAHPFVQHLVEIGGGIGGARDANERLLRDYDDDPWWRIVMKFFFNPVNLIAACFLWWVQQFIPALAAAIPTLAKEAILGLVLMIFSVIAVVGGYFYGAYQQKQKDES